MKRSVFKLFDYFVYAGGLAFLMLYALAHWGLLWTVLGNFVFWGAAPMVLGLKPNQYLEG
ncbi:hypothetical protein [Sphingomonas lacusdianchii]|uniref:hypothetical protein n=1 Tax=Sphingomonas lacusdianchii TaxID=2917992 RepID=UPI001F5717D5|nr:hypothetical protein [Sphingomonas sp. JXJ CY 53]